MKKVFTSLLLASIGLFSFGQCSTVNISVSSSDETYVQLYHAGLFNIPNGEDNVCEWEVTTFLGELVHEATTSGDFEEQSFMLFDHSVPTSDSMKVVLAITNETTGIICTITDTLFWEETEVIPGAFIYNWAILSGSVGVEEEITTSVENTSSSADILVYPTAVDDFFQVDGKLELYNITLLNASGQVVASHNNVYRNERVDMSDFAQGLYVIRVQDRSNRTLGVRKLIKR
jgi:hypothetical protein